MNVAVLLGQEDDLSLFSLSAEYLHSAEILMNAPVTKINVSLVIYYLLGHAAELLMKSFLYNAGLPIKQIKKNFGHDLDKLVIEVQSIGLHPPLALPQILALDKYYKAKNTEYRQLKAKAFPSKDLLLEEIRALSSRVFNQIYATPSKAKTPIASDDHQYGAERS
jgi:hypothetical protein